MDEQIRDEQMKLLGENLKLLRERKGLTLFQVSAMARVPLKVLQEMEDGVCSRKASVRHLFSLCELFGVTPKAIWQKQP